jgi:hypothetical protein
MMLWLNLQNSAAPTVEIISGEQFRIEVAGATSLHSIDGYPLRDGVRAAIGDQEKVRTPSLKIGAVVY